MIAHLLTLLCAATASEPSLPPDGGIPPRLWDITHLDLDVRIDPASRSLSGRATHTLEARGRPRDRIVLHQRALRIESAEVDGAPAPFEVGPDWVEVRLPPGERHTVTLTYSATPPTGLHFRGPAWGDAYTEVWSQGEDEDNRWWFPTWDHPTDRFTVDTHVEVPSDLTVRALGELVERTPQQDGTTRWSFSLDEPVVGYLVTLVAGPYRVFTFDGPVPIEVLAPPWADEALVRRAVEPIADQIRYFSELFGLPFPYSRFRAAFVQRFPYGGMENPTLTVLHTRVLAETAAAMDLRYSERVLAHEVAHHWFGDLLTCYGWNEWWLNEGFARYYELRWMEHHHGEDVGAVFFHGQLEQALDVERALAPRHPSAQSDGLFSSNTWSGAYPKGAAVLRGLELLLGRDVFDAGIRRYVAEHRGRLVESDDLRRALEDVSGQPLGWYFRQWVETGGSPRWDVERRRTAGGLELVVLPDAEAPAFQTPLTVEIGIGEGSVLHRSWLAAGRTHVVLPLDDRPRFVALDPAWAVPGRLELEQEPAAWLAQLRYARHPMARVRALRALGHVDADPTVLEALHRYAHSDRDVALRALAMESLGAHGAPAEAALLDAIDVPEATLRRAVAAALPATPDGIAALERMLGDPHGSVRVAAMERLAEHAPHERASYAARLLRSPDPSRQGWIHGVALRTLGEEGQGEPILRFLDDPRHLVRRFALRALKKALDTTKEEKEKKISARDRARWQARLARAVERALDDPEYAMRKQALEAAAALRPEDRPLLEQFILQNPVPALDERARAALDAIGKGDT